MPPRPPRLNAADDNANDRSRHGGSDEHEHEDDDDLADLLHDAAAPRETLPASGPYAKQQERVYHNFYQKNASMSCFEYISAYISVCCYYHPVVCSILTFGLGLFLFLLLVTLVLNPAQQFGISSEHASYLSSKVHSKYDLELNKIEHWCLGGGNSRCPYCEDPLVPQSRMEHASWTLAFNKNKKIVQKYVDDPLQGAELDVAFLGGSVVEEMSGRWMGKSGSSDGKNETNTSDNSMSSLRIFARLFRSNFQSLDKGIHGVALGIAGDSSPNVLYRIMHGEMPEQFNPKIYWLSLGMNDIARMQCSEEVTLIGILRVVEEILERKPHARIVINSLFPMITVREGDYPVLSDFMDSFELPRGVVIRHYKPTHQEEIEEGRRMLRFQSTDSSFDRRQLSKRDRKTRHRRQRDIHEEPRSRTSEEIVTLSEKEEEIRDIVARRRRRRRRERLNPILAGDKFKIRKFRPGFLGKRRLPLWVSIRHINKQLSEFAANNPRVYFFDSTSLFVSSTGVDRKRYHVMSDRISARGHPTEEGYRLWESAVMTRVKQVIDIMKIEEPDLFIMDNKASEDAGEWTDNSYFSESLDDAYDGFESGTDDGGENQQTDIDGDGYGGSNDDDRAGVDVDVDAGDNGDNAADALQGKIETNADDDKFTVDEQHRGENGDMTHAQVDNGDQQTVNTVISEPVNENGDEVSPEAVESEVVDVNQDSANVVEPDPEENNPEAVQTEAVDGEQDAANVGEPGPEEGNPDIAQPEAADGDQETSNVEEPAPVEGRDEQQEIQPVVDEPNSVAETETEQSGAAENETQQDANEAVDVAEPAVDAVEDGATELDVTTANDETESTPNDQV
ncbi:hypothetical protein MPSEU_000178900 [Mayamaea pseudoterrestris]|nr:hypothetical protein MPSEU_000178900 [Mayamaea pseudoterrestris]